MKRLVPLLLFGVFLLALAGCASAPAGTSAESSAEPAADAPRADLLSREDATSASASGSAETGEAGESEENGETEESALFTLETEWAVYDPTVEEIWFTIRNNGTGTLETGVDYSLEYDNNGSREVIPLQEGHGWEALSLVLSPGGTAALCCRLSSWEFSFPTGTYRIVKTIDGETAAGEFRLEAGASISLEQPCGFAPLESLPEDYDRKQAIADGCVVFPNTGEPRNTDALALFLEKVQLGIPCQVRLVRFTTEGSLILEDVRYEILDGTGRFAWQRDDSRDGFDASPGISEVFYYSFLVAGTTAPTVTIDENGKQELPSSPVIGLCNGLETGTRLDILWDTEAEPYLETVQAMTETAKEFSSVRCRIWNGTRYAVLTEDPLEFGWGGDGYGEMVSLAEYDGLDLDILELQWVDAHTLSLAVQQAETLDGSPSVRMYLWDTETGQLTATDAAYTVGSVISPRDL